MRGNKKPQSKLFGLRDDSNRVTTRHFCVSYTEIQLISNHQVLQNFLVSSNTENWRRNNGRTRL